MNFHPVLSADFYHRHYVAKLPAAGFLQDIDLDTGAAGANRAWHRKPPAALNVRLQEIGELHICQGIAKENARKIKRGVKVISYGMGLQRAEGAFPGEKTGMDWSATAFFLGAAANALLMLDAARRPEYESLRADWCAPLTRAVLWLDRTPPSFPELTSQACAAAGGAAMLGAVCASDEVVAAATKLAWQACALQSPEGFWPERGGLDTHYQAISLVYLSYALVTTDNAQLREALHAALARGFDWLEGKIADNGAVDCSGNTRKRRDRPPQDNEALRPGDFLPISFALRMWGEITGDEKWKTLSDRVDEWARQLGPAGHLQPGSR